MAKYFRITEAARDEILRQLSGSRVRYPVVYLIEGAPVEGESPELSEAYRNGADKAVIRELARKQLPSNLRDMLRLYPAIYSRWRFLPWDLAKIEGITFVLPLSLKRKIRDGVLDVADKGLKLEDANGILLLPRKALPTSVLGQR